MNITDIIKNKFIEEFSEISLSSLVTALVLSFALSLFIVFIYRITYAGVLYNSNFATGLILLSMITSLAILTISSNVVLSLGMVGALSIVRFRTAVKDPKDTIYMFWAIVTGITTGARLIPVSIISTLLIGLIVVLLHIFEGKFKTTSYMVVLRYKPEVSGRITSELAKMPKHRIKSSTTNANIEELVLEVNLRGEKIGIFNRFKKIEGVTEVNVLSYNGTTLL